MSSAPAPEARLPRRDVILLPLVAALTIALMLGGGELLARLLWAKQTDVACEIHHTATGSLFKPNCAAMTKAADGPWVENRFNDCGYRTQEPCGDRAPGGLRVAVIGSSTSRGALVSYPDSFAGRASSELSRRCRVPVDFQNLGTEAIDLGRLPRRVPELLRLKPDAVVMLIGPYDIQHLELDDGSALGAAPKEAKGEGGLNVHRAVEMLRTLRLFEVSQHYLYQDPALQIRAFVRGGDNAGYLTAPLPASWTARIGKVDQLMQRLAAPLEAHGVPLLLFYVPERAQAAMAKPEFTHVSRDEHVRVDTGVIGRALANVAHARQFAFADTTPAFAAAPDFNALYYLSDGHPSAGGHAAVASVVVPSLLRQPAFARCAQPAAMGAAS